jgi:hypothetical protein
LLNPTELSKTEKKLIEINILNPTNNPSLLFEQRDESDKR